MIEKHNITVPHQVDIHVGHRLRARRVMLGMSQEHLGDAVGVTFQQIQKYERGLNRIGASRLYEFSRILNIPVSYFYEGLELEENQHYLTNDDLISARENKETLSLMRGFRKIENAKQRKQVVALVKSMTPDQTGPNSDPASA